MFMRTKPYWTRFGVARGGGRNAPRVTLRGWNVPFRGHLTEGPQHLAPPARTGAGALARDMGN